MPLDLTFPGSLNREPHYRRYLRPDGTIHVVCVQDFDYRDYDASRFVDEDTFPTSVQAETAPITECSYVAPTLGSLNRAMASGTALCLRSLITSSTSPLVFWSAWSTAAAVLLVKKV